MCLTVPKLFHCRSAILVSFRLSLGVFLFGVAGLSAQSADLSKNLQAITASDGGSLVKWTAEEGVRYRLQSSTDMKFWRPEGTWSGLGQEVEIQVRPGVVGGGGGGGATILNLTEYQFLVALMPDNKSLITWKGEAADGSGGEEVYQVYGSLDFETAGQIPLQQVTVSDGGVPDHRILLVATGGTYHSSYDLLTTAALPVEQQDVYQKLVDAYSQIIQEINNASAQTNQQGALGEKEEDEERVFFRVLEDQQDFDGDGLWDVTEVARGLDPYDPDTDHDGVIDPWDDANIPNPVISEFMAVNGGEALLDEDGDASDWFEIYNPTSSAVNLSGWFLSDSPSQATMWTIPGIAGDPVTLIDPTLSLVLQPGETKVFFASNKNRTTLGGELHTNFALGSDGDEVILRNPAQGVVDQHLDYPQQRENTSAGWGLDLENQSIMIGAGNLRFFFEATPGAVNSTDSCLDLLEAPGIVWNRIGEVTTYASGGYFSNETLVVTIFPTELNVTLHYTIDGSNPTSDSPVFSQDPLNPTTLTVSETTVVRAVASRNDCPDSPITSLSFLFPEDFLGTAPQGTLPTDYQQKPVGYPGDVLFRGSDRGNIDFDLNPEIIRDHRDDMIDEFMKFPTISISLPKEEFFGLPGIYSNSYSTSFPEEDPLEQDWERLVSVEFIDPDDPNDPSDSVFYNQENCIVKISGNSSRRDDVTGKHNLRIKFSGRNSKRGNGKWGFGSYDPFEDSVESEFKQLVLRNPTQDSWAFRKAPTTTSSPSAEWAVYIREAWARDQHRLMGADQISGSHLIAHRRWVHLYINGFYWGLYDISERIDEDFLEAYLGNGDFDLLKQPAEAGGPIQADEGDTVAWGNLSTKGLELRNDMTNVTLWNQVQAQLDVDNYIDYVIVNMFMGNTDWDGSNWRAYRERPSGKFRFLIWDCETSMRPDRVSDLDLTDRSGGVLGPYGALRTVGFFQEAFKARVQKHFEDSGGVFSIDPMGGHLASLKFQEVMDDFESGIHLESSRWGDQTIQPSYDQAHWQSEASALRDTYIVTRRNVFLNQLRAKGLANPAN